MNNKNINYDDMTDVEIEEVIKKLQKIKKERKTNNELIIKNKDTNGLKKYLSTHNQKLSPNMVKSIELFSLTDDNIDFLDVLITSKNWESFISDCYQKNFLITQSVKQPKIVNYLIEKHFNFFKKELGELLARTRLIVKDKSVLRVLFDKKIIQLNMINESSWLNTFGNNLDILLFAIQNKYIKNDMSKLMPVIYQNLPNVEIKHIDKLLESLPQKLELDFDTFKEFLFDIHMSDETMKEEVMEEFLIIEKENFLKILELMNVPQSYVIDCISSIASQDIFDPSYDEVDYDYEGLLKHKQENCLLLITYAVSKIKNNFTELNNLENILQKKTKKIKDKNFKDKIMTYFLEAKLTSTLLPTENTSHIKKTKI